MTTERELFEAWRASRSSALSNPTDWDAWQAARAAPPPPAAPTGIIEGGSSERSNDARASGDRVLSPGTTGVDHQHGRETQELSALPAPNDAPPQHPTPPAAQAAGPADMAVYQAIADNYASQPAALSDDEVRAIYRQVFHSPFAPKVYGLAEEFARAIERAVRGQP